MRCLVDDIMVTANTESMYWMSKEEWYRVNTEKDVFELTENAPDRAVKSFGMYKEINNLK